jgi:hypothetical protein
MASYTRLVHSEEPRRISSDLLWWRDGTWTMLSPDIRDGKATLRINGELADIFRELATRPPGTESTTG